MYFFTMFDFWSNVFTTKTLSPFIHVCLRRVTEWGGVAQAVQGWRDEGLVIRKLECGSRCVM